MTVGRHPLLHRRFRMIPTMMPLIDVIFLLIVFFMLVAQINRHRKLELDLPMLSGEVKSADVEARIVVEVVPDGGYRVGTRTVGADELAAALAARRGALSGATVEVRADRAERYERVVPVLRALEEAGFDGADLIVQAERSG